MTVEASNVELSVDRVLGELTLQEKAAPCLGSDFWHRGGHPAGRSVGDGSDGPHGLRAQMNEADHVGLSGSVPATCFPPACALGSSWNPRLFVDVGAAIAREARKWGSRSSWARGSI